MTGRRDTAVHIDCRSTFLKVDPAIKSLLLRTVNQLMSNVQHNIWHVYLRVYESKHLRIQNSQRSSCIYTTAYDSNEVMTLSNCLTCNCLAKTANALVLYKEVIIRHIIMTEFYSNEEDVRGTGGALLGWELSPLRCNSDGFSIRMSMPSRAETRSIDPRLFFFKSRSLCISSGSRCWPLQKKIVTINKPITYFNHSNTKKNS